MTTILWLSRHDMFPDQIRELRRAYGEDVEIVKKDVTVSSGEDVVKLAEEVGANVIAAVLPRALVRETSEGPVFVDVLQETVELTDKPVIQAVTSHRTAEGGVREMVFVGWSRVESLGGFKNTWL